MCFNRKKSICLPSTLQTLQFFLFQNTFLNNVWSYLNFVKFLHIAKKNCWGWWRNEEDDKNDPDDTRQYIYISGKEEGSKKGQFFSLFLSHTDIFLSWSREICYISSQQNQASSFLWLVVVTVYTLLYFRKNKFCGL